jgi:hypothetical protein
MTQTEQSRILNRNLIRDLVACKEQWISLLRIAPVWMSRTTIFEACVGFVKVWDGDVRLFRFNRCCVVWAVTWLHWETAEGEVKFHLYPPNTVVELGDRNRHV